MSHVVWTQWADLEGPPGFRMVGPEPPDELGAVAEEITFYVPRYLGGRESFEVIPSLPALQVVQLPNAGYEDALEFLPPGVKLCNARGVHDVSTAELALGLIIASQRDLATFMQGQHAGRWEPHVTRSTADARVGIVGHGSIGSRLHRMLEPFDTTVVGFTSSGRDGTVPVTELDHHLPDLDVVVLLVPATPQTIGMFDARRLGLMKQDSLLVNVSRGPVVDTTALVEALGEHRIRAALDVTDPEPLPADHPLWDAPRCIITPHVGGASHAFEPRMRRLVREQLARLAAGEPLVNVVAEGDQSATE